MVFELASPISDIILIDGTQTIVSVRVRGNAT